MSELESRLRLYAFNFGRQLRGQKPIYVRPSLYAKGSLEARVAQLADRILLNSIGSLEREIVSRSPENCPFRTEPTTLNKVGLNYFGHSRIYLPDTFRYSVWVKCPGTSTRSCNTCPISQVGINVDLGTHKFRW